MKNTKLRRERELKGWSQRVLADRIGTNTEAISRWECGHHVPERFYQERLCEIFGKTAEELGFIAPSDTAISTALVPSNLKELWADDILEVYGRGIAACYDLHFGGNSQQVEAILPLYCTQTASLAQQLSPLQKVAAGYASKAHHLACELATDREDFGEAGKAGKQAFQYGQLAEDRNLQVAALITIANLAFHRKLSIAARDAYHHAVSLLNEDVTPLLKGRTYAGLAEVYAMRKDLQDSMRAMGFAYEHYPMQPENDPAYTYLRASRYSLYVFGDAQSRLFLRQPVEADRALIDMQKETNDPQIEPITKLDLLYYQTEVHMQQEELEASRDILADAAILARELGSRLYFNKLAVQYHELLTCWPHETQVKALDEVFAPW